MKDAGGGGQTTSHGNRPAVVNLDTGDRVSQGLSAGDVSADEILLEDYSGGPSTSNQNAIVLVGRDDVAGAHARPADRVTGASGVHLDAAGRVAESERPGDIRSDLIPGDDVETRTVYNLDAINASCG